MHKDLIDKCGLSALYPLEKLPSNAAQKNIAEAMAAAVTVLEGCGQTSITWAVFRQFTLYSGKLGHLGCFQAIKASFRQLDLF
jgi:hypothetical protein